MRWGFGWELGPFEIMEAIGMETGERSAEAVALPRLNGRSARLRRRPRRPADPEDRAAIGSKIVRKNAGASLVDLGDGVLALEFHSKMNAIGGDRSR